MDLRRVFAALGLATLLAIIVTFAVSRALRKNRGAGGLVLQIVVAARDLPAGAALTTDDVKLADWPVGSVPSGSFSKVSDVVKRPLIYPLGEKEPILERNLAVQGSGLGLAARIPAGMRATSVRSNEVVGVAGFLYPGSRVDVLATFAPSGNVNPATQTILQNVEVLTAGEKIEPDPEGKPQTVNVVTLLVNAEDSQRLLLASTQGTIQFVLRNSADDKTPPVVPTSLNQLMSGSMPVPPRPAGGAVKRQSPTSAVTDAYGIEIVRGNQRTMQTF